MLLDLGSMLRYTSPFKVLLTFFVLIAVLLPSTLFADAPGSFDSAGIMIRVRMVRAEGLINNHDHRPNVSSVRINVDKDLKDIDSQLRNLNYRFFHLVSSNNYFVPVLRKHTIYLAQGNALTVRPIYTDGSRVGLWLRWLNESGQRVLDTRMHFNGEETVLTGTENHQGGGIILAIDVESLKNPPANQ